MTISKTKARGYGEVLKPSRRGLRPGQRLDQLRAPVHRDDVRGHQVHAPGLQADPVGNGAGRPGSGGRGGPVHPPARAGHRVQVMLDDLRGNLRNLHLLVRGSHPQVHGAARSAPHAHAPGGKCGTARSGSSLQARYEPGAPGCLPGFRPPRL